MKLFGTDGVRGKAGNKLTASKAMKLAMAAGIYFRKQGEQTNKIIVGKDTRRSGYMIENALVSGLTAVGYNVLQIGPMPTPTVAFLSEDMRCDAGIMISASHNPFGDNGIKFFDKTGNKLGVDAEREIEKIYFDDSIIEKNQKTDMEIGASKRIDDVEGRYIVHIKNSFEKKLSMKNKRVVLDVANGAAYKVAPTIFSELGAEVIVLNNEPNGENINNNCGALHPESLAYKVKELRADIGFAFDGDADRLVVVDEEGKIVHGDMLLAALALHLKEVGKLNANTAVATHMSNQSLEEYLHVNKIKLIRCDVGDKHVLDVLNSKNLNFGGEQSGHIIIKEIAKTGDALAAAMAVMSYMLTKNKKASELLHPFELAPQLQKNISIHKKIPLDEIKGYKEKIEELKNKKIRTLIRYSGTENLLRILLEGKNTNELHVELDKMIEFFGKNLK